MKNAQRENGTATPRSARKGYGVEPLQIRPQQVVVCSKGGRFATVDHVEGGSLVLRADVDGSKHTIPVRWVTSVDERVHVDRPGEQVMREWLSWPVDA